jgi:hypothetical protein
MQRVPCRILPLIFESARFLLLAIDYESGLTNIKNKTPGIMFRASSLIVGAVQLRTEGISARLHFKREHGS